jgi:phosphohistidine phosphatase
MVASAELPEPPEIRLDDRVYAATGSALLEVVRWLDVPTALLVGHNPGLEDLLELLTGEYAELPTASIAVVDVEAGTLLAYGRPPR